ncbi:MAG: HAD family hydrolase [Treponema sp.]|nr:HAD family hydrolase [Treponema sp.]
MGEGGNDLKGIAFDLDGTLYPNYRFYLRLVIPLLRHPRFYRAFALTRRRLHRDGQKNIRNDFYRRQAALMSEILGARIDEQYLEEKIYRRWEDCFKRINLFPHVRETLATFKKAGLRLGLLSDFPPERKLVYLHLDEIFDAALCSEKTGCLKPCRLPFETMAGSLGLEPQTILYTGNSPRFDMAGARAAGMKTALIKRGPLSTGRAGFGGTDCADFVFRDYRQLVKYVLG